MGACSSSAAVTKDNSKPSVIIAILGTGGVGKSTLFKQVKLLTNMDYSDDQKEAFMPYLIFNVMGAMKALKERINKRQGEYGEPVSDASCDLIDAFPAQDWRSNAKLANPEERGSILANIGEAWKDPVLRDAWAQMDADKSYVGWTAVDELAPQLLSHVDVICAPGYVPDSKHLILLRRKTRGIEQLDFSEPENGQMVRLIDLGGQVCERQMWEMHLQECSAVIWMVALSDYNRVSKEGSGENCLRESIRVFEEIAKEKTFRGLPFVLLFNKDDVFREKLKKQDLSEIPTFDSYRGDTVADAYQFIAQRFLQLSEDNQHYSTCFRTCATDTEVVTKIWNSMLESIIGSSLGNAGLM